MASLRSPFSHPVFVRFFAGQAASQMGDFVFYVALPWQVLQLGGTAADLGGVFASFTAAQLLLLTWGGAIVDRLSRRWLVVSSDIAQGSLAATLALLAFTDILTLWHLYLLGALFGASQAFAMPALSAFVPETVPPEDLQAANSLYQGTRTITAVAGPAVGAAIIALGDTAAAFAFDAATFVISSTLLATARRSTGMWTPPPPTTSHLSDIREGWRYVRRTPWIWVGILIFAFFNAAEAGPRNVVLPEYVGVRLEGGATAIGLVFSSMAAGELVGYLLPNFMPPFRRRGVVAYAVTGLSGVTVMLLGFTSDLWVILVLSFGRGATLAIFGLIWQSSLMELVDERFRGRVFSLDMLGSFSLMPFSLAASGVVAELFDPQTVFFFGGLGILGLAAVGLLYPPAHRFERPRAGPPPPGD